MPEGFQTQALILAAERSTASGVLKVEGEGDGSLDLSTQWVGLTAGGQYVLRFRSIPSCTFTEGNDRDWEAPRSPVPDTSGHEADSFVARLPKFVANERGAASMKFKVAGRLERDWWRLTVALFPADRAQPSDPWLACGKLGTVKVQEVP